ncbi:MAG: virulence RhuM family protein [Fibrobacter sp.]|uniref:RhuM family protein n=1 Tax=Fibrobacter sp. TaxID=35828 RepID=UPI0025BD1766|nr:RhuM family protein [Fibrobacter sp.]MBQ3715769.1 virulence RhuM family protein [Fibrobacter sp.]MBQ7078163.1 virulence RhuM family protein [Fibrobacter sp.]
MSEKETLPVADKNEIIVYQPEGGEFHIEVRVENETVWLTQAQMAELFNSTRNNVTLHIKNIFQEHELDANSVCKESLLTANDGKKYKTKIYNLDVIISVGYRVKSIQGTRFRQWANQVLKEHMLKGFSVNQRLVSHENRLEDLDSRVIYLERQVDFFVKANLPPSEGLLPAHAHWSGYEFAVQLVRSAKKELFIIDPYANDMVLSLMAKRAQGVDATIYSARITRTMREEEARLNRQFPTVRLENMREVHDRFVIVDDVIYHVGASLKDLGNQMTAFSVLNFVTKEQVLAMVK